MKKFKASKKFDKIKLLKKRNQELRTDNDRMASERTVWQMKIDGVINDLEMITNR